MKTIPPTPTTQPPSAGGGWHTPGQWVITQEAGKPMCVAQVNSIQRVATIADQSDARTTLANAKLIATAPALLEALEYALKYPQALLNNEGFKTEIAALLAAPTLTPARPCVREGGGRRISV